MENDRHALRQRNQYRKNDPYLIIPIKHFYVVIVQPIKNRNCPFADNCGYVLLC